MGNGANTVSGSTVSNTELSEFFGAHRVPGRELSEFLSAYYLCAKANSPNSPQNSPSLPQNSVRLSEFSPPKEYHLCSELFARSGLDDPAEWPKIGLLNRGFGNILSIFPRKNSKTQSSLNFLQSGPRKFTKSDFSGLAPIRRVLICQNHYTHEIMIFELFRGLQLQLSGVVRIN